MADNPNANRPASGSYGEDADRDRLEAGIKPTMDAQPAGGPPAPVRTTRPQTPPGLSRNPVGRPPGPVPPPGIPGALAGPGSGMAPPVHIDPATQMAQLPPDQQTLFILDTLATSPQVSPDTRAWAAGVLSMLLDADGDITRLGA